MSRPPRIRLPGLTLHVVQRGNNRAAAFHQPQDYIDYLDILRVAIRRYETRVHAFVLMTNHVHLLLTSSLADGVSNALRYVGSRYVSRFNGRYGRTGTLWESRFRSSPVDTEFYCLACYRYIELNPVRANLVQVPEDYRWSSYGINSAGQRSSLITPHPTYISLDTTPEKRAERYRKLVREALPDTALRVIREGTRTGVPTGRECFRKSLESSLERRLGTGRRGRPSRSSGTTEAQGEMEL
jgi:putative transposase